MRNLFDHNDQGVEWEGGMKAQHTLWVGDEKQLKKEKDE